MLTRPNGIQSQTVLDYGAIKKGAQLSSGKTTYLGHKNVNLYSGTPPRCSLGLKTEQIVSILSL